MKRQLIVLLVACAMFYAYTATADPLLKRFDSIDARQIVVVIAADWDTARGILYAFEKVNDAWELKFSNPVFIGAKGLGIGDGIAPFSVEGAPVKHEGDLKAPAGIFKIGAAFGYAESARAKWIKDTYIQAKDTVFCVDDPNSVYYNQLISADTAGHKGWRSFEYMHRHDDYYKWGLFVEHNAPNTVPGHGSCIFIHIGLGERYPTEGCTAMSEADLLRLLHWIDASKQPLLVQMPAELYTAQMQRFRLPAIK